MTSLHKETFGFSGMTSKEEMFHASAELLHSANPRQDLNRLVRLCHLSVLQEGLDRLCHPSVQWEGIYKHIPAQVCTPLPSAAAWVDSSQGCTRTLNNWLPAAPETLVRIVHCKTEKRSAINKGAPAEEWLECVLWHVRVQSRWLQQYPPPMEDDNNYTILVPVL